MWLAEGITFYLYLRTDVVVFIACNFVRFLSFILEPYLPSTSAKINFILNQSERTEQDAVLGKILNKDFKG